MKTCQSCGGLIGRDCFNPIECAEITASMNDEQIVQPYIDALREALDTIEQMSNHMSVIDSNMQETIGNLIDNTVNMINRCVPPLRNTSTSSAMLDDDLPF